MEKGPGPRAEEGMAEACMDRWHSPCLEKTMFPHTLSSTTELHFLRSRYRPYCPDAFPAAALCPPSTTPTPPPHPGSQSSSHTFNSVRPDACVLLKEHQSQQHVEEKTEYWCSPSPPARPFCDGEEGLGDTGSSSS